MLASFRIAVAQCINQIVLQSQLPHNVVNVFFAITIDQLDDSVGELTF